MRMRLGMGTAPGSYGYDVFEEGRVVAFEEERCAEGSIVQRVVIPR